MSVGDQERLTRFFHPFTHNYVEAMRIAGYVDVRREELRAILEPTVHHDEEPAADEHGGAR